jgi:hypothetical protein
VNGIRSFSAKRFVNEFGYRMANGATIVKHEFLKFLQALEKAGRQGLP